MWRSLGKVTCTVPNTAYRITSNETAPGAHYTCFALLFEQIPGNTDYFYILDRDIALNATTLVGVVAIVAKPTVDAELDATTIPFATVTIPQAAGPLNAADFYVASPTAGLGVLVSAVRL